MEKETTSERIIEAAIELVSKKGYKATTTKAIADLAGVNEVTIFRNFGNKRGILNAVIQKFSYGPLLQKVIQEQATWDLEYDLYHFSTQYQNYMFSIKEYVLISFKEAGAFPEIDQEVAKIPLFIKQELVAYFCEMEKRGKLTDVDIEAIAMTFIHLNFGHFISRARLGSSVTKISTEDIFKTSISIFSRGLTP
ncbi:TetR/AcrR family transcriptional regulator [Solibacillus sp. FSL K6-1523]|uniref:TetR/AcrR family transcriptional regulator n=1 Tax=Solibacillus sp. FSL K6-1523 TaxID=2921471 RepID=UPI0030F74CE8